RADESLPMDAALIDIGLDSLMAVDLKNRLQIALGQELSPTVIFDYPTVFEIAGMLDARLWASQGNSEDHLALSQKDEIRI
ncbi:MAG TPA: acyl carrier protein, partial [Acidobacteriaceae bacterium]|nr:acyl carrier protein [Acidobacteriaceae bacterium]